MSPPERGDGTFLPSIKHSGVHRPLRDPDASAKEKGSPLGGPFFFRYDKYGDENPEGSIARAVNGREPRRSGRVTALHP